MIPNMQPRRTFFLGVLFYLLFLVASRFLARSNNEQKTSRFTIDLIVLAKNRPEPLLRCLESIRNADYEGHTVNLFVFIDSYKNTTELPSIERTVEVARTFAWPHGIARVHQRHGAGGILLQWLECWYPKTDDEYTYVVEDDTEVSPFFYRFLRLAVQEYRYGKFRDRQMYGISLQRQQLVPAKVGRAAKSPKPGKNAKIYGYQLVGTWGQLLFPEHWREFVHWFDARRATGVRPFLGNMRTDDWYRSKGDTIWTPWFIRFVFASHYYQVYTYFPGGFALAASHRDAGQNTPTSIGPDARLVNSSLDWETAVAPSKLPVLSRLTVYDYCFRPWPPQYTGTESLGELLARVSSSTSDVAVAVVTGGVLDLFNNWLCSVTKASVNNVLVFAPTLSADAVLDIRRRGVAVYTGENRRAALPESVEFGSLEYQRLISLRVGAVKDILHLGYNVLIADVDAVWRRDPFPLLRDESHDHDIVYQTDNATGLRTNACGGFIYLKHADASLVFWAAVEKEHTRILAQVDAGKRVIGFVNEQIIINKFLNRGTPPVRHKALPAALFPAGNVFFGGEYPGKNDAAVVHANWIVGRDKKRKLLEEAELWELDAFDGRCVSVICTV